MSIPRLGPVDTARAAWNDEMYGAHPTPYASGIARWIELARVREVARLAAAGRSGHLAAGSWRRAGALRPRSAARSSFIRWTPSAACPSTVARST